MRDGPPEDFLHLAKINNNGFEPEVVGVVWVGGRKAWKMGMVQPVWNDVSRQERSKHSEMNLKLFTLKFRAVRLERAHPVNCPETCIEIYDTVVTNEGGSGMTKSSGDIASLRLLGCAHVNCKDGGCLFLSRRL